MNRRRFLRGALAVAGLCLPGACGPRPAWQQKRIPRIGFLAPTPREGQLANVENIPRALAELGYVDGQNIVIEWRFAEDESQLPALAAELVALNVDAILPSGTPAALAARDATATIPIIINSSDPVGAGLVASLSHPGGNVTGTTNYNPQLVNKKLALLRDVVPGAVRIAFLTNPNNPTYAAQEKELQDAAGALGIQLLRLEVRAAEQIEGAFAAAYDWRAQGLLVPADSLVLAPQRAKIAGLALRQRLPSIFIDRRDAEAGGLMSYGVDLFDQFQGRAAYVDRILKGAKPADLPIEGPKRFDFVINLKTAQALGLTIPPSVLQQATSVIE